VNIVANERRNATLVATTATTETEGDRVWVVEDGRARARQVKIGIKDLAWTEVLAGLSEGEQVVVDADGTLRDGARVQSKVEVRSPIRNGEASASRGTPALSGTAAR
jgi:HlyD family secretion protein